MREIKFRAWNKAYDFMMDIEKISLRNNCVYFDGEWWEDCELMQCTGLHDKNGVEIFEGDILKEGISIGKVEYSKSSFNIQWFSNKDFWSAWLEHHSEHCEIVGNIYENPELLQEVTK